MILYILVLILFLVGLYGILTNRNLIKIIFGVMIMRFAINILFMLLGYAQGGIAPIVMQQLGIASLVDPLPQHIVIVSIGLELAAFGVLISLAIRLYKEYGTFDISKINKLNG